MQPGDVSYRCNMVALEDGDQPFNEKKILSHNAGSIEGHDSIKVITWLFADPEFRAAADAIHLRIEPTPSFRHIAIQTGGDTNGMWLHHLMIFWVVQSAVMHCMAIRTPKSSGN